MALPTGVRYWPLVAVVGKASWLHLSLKPRVLLGGDGLPPPTVHQ